MGKTARVSIETLAEDLAAGMTASAIARKHGMGRETVRQRLNTWQPGCCAKQRTGVVVRRRQRAEEDVLPREVIGANGPTHVCADDGQIYCVGMVWLRDWACLSFSGGLVELLVAVDSGRPWMAIGRAPIVCGEPLIGVRVFADRNGVQRTWKAYAARPKYRDKGFPRRLIHEDQPVATDPRGTFLWRCSVHNQALRLIELRSAH